MSEQLPIGSIIIILPIQSMMNTDLVERERQLMILILRLLKQQKKRNLLYLKVLKDNYNYLSLLEQFVVVSMLLDYMEESQRKNIVILLITYEKD
jgi:hypothetical protein